MNRTTNQLSPAYLWIGSPADLANKAVTFLQSALCPAQCGSCTNCTKIAKQQHHAAIWLMPEKQYTLDQLEVIFNTISFTLDDDQKCFFIIQHADFLTPVCANALLKPLEEPPPGYHFILLAQRQERILPTIRSRCIIQQYAHTSINEHDQLLRHFKTVTSSNPQQLLNDIETAKPNERTSIELLDALLEFWSTSFKKACTSNDVKQKCICIQVINVLRTAYKRPPMPGSAKLFWKDLFLQVKSIKS